jgi:Flp pilus assembly protein TadD
MVDYRRGFYGRLPVMKQMLKVMVLASLMVSCWGCVEKEHSLERRVSILEDEANAAMRSGNYEQAEKKFRAVLDIDPDKEHIQNNLAVLYAEYLNNTEKAIELWQDLVTTRPKNAAYYNNLANMYWQNGDLDKALETYKLSTEHHKQYHMPYYNMAQIYMIKENFKEAEIQARQGYNRAPNDHRMLTVYVRVLLINGKRDEARSIVENGLSTMQDSVFLNLMLARIHTGSKNYSDASRVITDALAKHPTNELLLAEKVELLHDRGENHDQIDKVFLQIDVLDNSQLMPWYEELEKARRQKKNSELDSAFKILEELEQKIPGHLTYFEGLRLNEMANIMQLKNQHEKALDYRSRAIIFAPERVVLPNRESPENGG